MPGGHAGADGATPPHDQRAGGRLRDCAEEAVALEASWLGPYWSWGLAVIGIVYGALVALVQKDFKFVIGYSSVSHMGFVLLGMMTLSQIGLSGAVLQMFSHGIIASLLFAVVGRMVYDTFLTCLPETSSRAKIVSDGT